MVINRKPNPSVRQNIHVVTLKKIEQFLKEKTHPIYKSEITRKINVDYNSLKLALTMIEHKKDEDGRIYL